MQGSALLWHLNTLGHWGHLLAVSPQHSRSASSHSTERRGGPGGSLTPMGYDPKARHALILSALGRKPYFSFLCCLRLSSLPPPSLPLVSSRSVMTFKFGLRCHTADPSTVKSVASGRQMAEGEAQHLWFLKVSARSLLTPASQPQAELRSRRCHLREGQPSDASTLPICPGRRFCRLGWSIDSGPNRQSLWLQNMSQAELPRVCGMELEL